MNSRGPLTIGDSGKDVAAVHAALMAAGWKVPGTEVAQRRLGPATRELIRGWQQQHGLAPSGDVDEPTRALMLAAPAERGSPGGSTPTNGHREGNGASKGRGTKKPRGQALKASREAFAQQLLERRAFRRVAEEKFGAFLSKLSVVSEDAGKSQRYVARGQSVSSAMRTVMRSNIQRAFSSASAAGALALDEDQWDRFTDSSGQLLGNVAAAEIEPMLGLGNQARVRRSPVAALCHGQVHDTPCLGLLNGGSTVVEHEDGHTATESSSTAVEVAPASGENANGQADVPHLISTLLKDMTSPEAAVVFDLNSHTNVEADAAKGVDNVHKGVKASTLRGGPADADAVFDFHHVRIAFESVWQELFDQGLEKNGRELYAKFVELGLDPNEYLVGDSLLEVAKFTLADIMKDVVAAGSNTQKNMNQAVALPAVVMAAFEITPEEWTALGEIPASIAPNIWQRNAESGKYEKDGDDKKKQEEEWLDWDKKGELSDAQKLLGYIAEMLVQPISKDYYNAENTSWMSWKQEYRRLYRRQGERLIGYVRSRANAPLEFDQFHELLKEIATTLDGPYRFSVYAANERERSINFGVITTYRQRWQPGEYQAGRLLKTVPLAPKEVRRFTKKVNVKQSRAEKEVNNNLTARKSESSETSRVEAEIVQKARKSTNFKMSAEGGVNIGIADVKASSGASQDAGTESQETKKEFHEAVFKAAEEYKAERTHEINVTDATETQGEESGEISNPNDEITVTYLFYELQRRFQVSEQIHKLTPVVLVAQEFPRPSDITEAWVVAHDWILRRVILDDSFVPAMNYVTSRVVGDEVALRELYKNVDLHRRLAEELKGELAMLQAQTSNRYQALQSELERHAAAIQADDESSGFTIVPLPVPVVPTGSDVSVDAAKAQADAARDAYERAARQEKEMQARLDREVTALASITETYTKTLSEHLNRKEQIARLLVHVKANIMHYMQAIWSHEPPDQRFFRLHEVPVPVLKGTKSYSLVSDPDAIPVPPEWKKPVKVKMTCKIDPDLVESEPLEQVADLDNLLGFKGNYMMFPLRKTNPITELLSLPHVDPFLGLRDPDPLGGWTLKEFADYVCCLYSKVPKARFNKLLPGLTEAYQQIQKSDGQGELIVPTDSLFIEVLPGAHPILENFKLMHRAVDVKKVQAEVRGLEFENLRFAARLMSGEREDPTIERKIVVEGGAAIVPGDGP
jgi:hypothetical protein